MPAYRGIKLISSCAPEVTLNIVPAGYSVICWVITTAPRQDTAGILFIHQCATVCTWPQDKLSWAEEKILRDKTFKAFSGALMLTPRSTVELPLAIWKTHEVSINFRIVWCGLDQDTVLYGSLLDQYWSINIAILSDYIMVYMKNTQSAAVNNWWSRDRYSGALQLVDTIDTHNSHHKQQTKTRCCSQRGHCYYCCLFWETISFYLYCTPIFQ